MLLFRVIRSDGMIKYEALRMPPLHFIQKNEEEGFIIDDENRIIFRWGMLPTSNVPLIWDGEDINKIGPSAYCYSSVREVNIPEGIEVIE